jgi:hypothetical protein
LWSTSKHISQFKVEIQSLQQHFASIRKGISISARGSIDPENFMRPGSDWQGHLEKGGLMFDEEMIALFHLLKLNFRNISEIFKDDPIFERNSHFYKVCRFCQGVLYHLMAIALYGQRSQINENLRIDSFTFDSSLNMLFYYPRYEKVTRRSEGIPVMKWGVAVIFIQSKIRKFLMEKVSSINDDNRNNLWISPKVMGVSGGYKYQLIRFFQSFYNSELFISESRTYRRTLFTKFVNAELDFMIDQDFQIFSRNLEMQFNVHQKVMLNCYNQRNPVEAYKKVQDDYMVKYIDPDNANSMVQFAEELLLKNSTDIVINDSQEEPKNRMYVIVQDGHFQWYKSKELMKTVAENEMIFVYIANNSPQVKHLLADDPL